MASPPAARRLGSGLWPGLALGGGQLAIMSTNFVFGLSMAYAGGLPAVGATAPAMLTFQLTCGVMQRVLAEASLLLSASAETTVAPQICRWAVANALLGGAAGAVLAVATSYLVPGGNPLLGVVFAVGIPFAIALDIGRSAAVASGVARPAAIEGAAWALVQAAAFLGFAATHSPLGICTAWTVVNVLFAAAGCAWPYRRPAARGALAWLRSRRGVVGPAWIDAFLAGLTPLVALQLSAFVTSVATIGAIRLLQQVFSPLAFVSVSLRRLLVYRRRSDAVTTRADNLRDGVLATALMAVGVGVLMAAVTLAGTTLPGFGFLPVGVGLVLAGVEKLAQGFSFGCSLGAFVRGEFRDLLLARYVAVVLTVALSPPATAWLGVAGYLGASAAAFAVYSAIVLLPGSGSRRRAAPAHAYVRSSRRPAVDARPATPPPGPPARP